ncbi:MAG: TolC family protein [Ignavibacteriales bacterium]|nr:TolC family protein [Ignavibacteriales bacterium]
MEKYGLICLIWICAFPVFAQRALTLDESKKLALQNNAKIKNGVLEMEASRQTSKAAFTRYFPSISATGAMFEAQKNMMEISTQGGNLPVYDGNLANLRTATQFAYMPASTMGLMKSGTFGVLTAVQPIFAGGRIWNGNRLASLGEDVSEQKNRLAQNEVLLKTEEQYWIVVSLNEKTKTIQRYEDFLNSLLSQVEDAFKSGLVSRNDLLKVKVKRSEVLLNKSKVENGRRLATMAFCQHIGIPYDSTLTLIDSLGVDGSPLAFSVDHIGALKNRSEYRLLQASVRAEELQSNMKLGEYLPQAGIGVTGLYMKLDESKDRTLGMVFGTVSIPISGWWEASHTLQERSIREQIAQNTMKDNSELLLLQMQKAWQDLTDAYKQVYLSEEAKSQADENLKVNRDSYSNGMSNLSDLLEAQALQQQMNDQLTDAKASYRGKQTVYLQVTGR